MGKDFTPHPYQALMLDHMVDRERCAVWAGMGLGKTSSALTALDALFLAGEDHPALVLAPLRVARSTWPKEARKWNHLRHISVVPVTGSDAEKRLALKQDASVFTCNYDNLLWLCEYFDGRWPFSTVISDESTRLKGFRLRQGGKRARALGRVAHQNSKRFIELTGTPAPNGLKDLWGQMWFIDGGVRLGRTHTGFIQRWFRPSPDGYGSIPLQGAADEIHALLRDVCLSIDAKDWFDLAEPIVTNIEIDLPPRARIQYDDMEKTMFAEIEEFGVEAFNAAARTQKCAQLANGAIYVSTETREWKETHEEKLLALESIIEESAGNPVLVAYNFKHDLARILKRFPQAKQLDANPATEDAWNAGKIPILVAHPASAGHGLNLQDGGNIVVFFGHDWNLEYYQQILERIGPVRQMQSGHDRPVFVYHIVAKNTVDELMMARRESKREVQDILLEAMKRRK